jgi:hypothetical protein
MAELQQRRSDAARIRREHVRNPAGADPVDLVDALLAADAAAALAMMAKRRRQAGR